MDKKTLDSDMIAFASKIMKEDPTTRWWMFMHKISEHFDISSAEVVSELSRWYEHRAFGNITEWPKDPYEQWMSDADGADIKKIHATELGRLKVIEELVTSRAYMSHGISDVLKTLRRLGFHLNGADITFIRSVRELRRKLAIPDPDNNIRPLSE